MESGKQTSTVHDTKYSEILSQNRTMRASLDGPQYHVSFLSNIVLGPLPEIVEFSLRIRGINAQIHIGDYDNIPQNSMQIGNTEAVVIFWELANIIDGLQYKANHLSETETQQLINTVCGEIDLVFKNLSQTSLLIVNKFSSLIFNRYYLADNKLDEICHTLNAHLKQAAPPQALIIDIDKVISEVSISDSVDFRHFYSSKALYTAKFYKQYTDFITPAFATMSGQTPKALIFDCDNTLWDGVIGEEGLKGIQMSSHTPNGTVYEEVQYLAKELAQKGILLGICSKNNEQDVHEVLSSHDDIRLRDFTVERINWNDKVTNLREIAEELNIGLDSLVFVDDSEFEIGHINTSLPQVSTIQVPSQRSLYPNLMRATQRLFFNPSTTTEDQHRQTMYGENRQRVQSKAQYEDIGDYLKSLKLGLHIFKDPEPLAPRLAQLTQKTNQFNLTTQRYTEQDILRFIRGQDHTIYAFEAQDKFGKYGVTGLSIIRHEKNESAHIDTFLISCRVMGRNLEFEFLTYILNDLYLQDRLHIIGRYLKTEKNTPASEFYATVGFSITSETKKETQYKLHITELAPQKFKYIGVHDGRSN